MNYYLVDENNIIQNIIVYDGVSPFDPSPLILKTSENVYNIGDVFVDG